MIPEITLNQSTPVYFLGHPDFRGGFFPDGEHSHPVYSMKKL